jgi:hypothetical protein
VTRQQILIAALLAVLLAVVVGFWLRRSSEPAAEGRHELESDEPMVAAEGDEVRLRLYFPGAEGLLVSEERVLATEGAGANLATIAAEVVAGPTGQGLLAPFPTGTEVGNVFISRTGIAYVDLVSTSPHPPSSGSRQEMLSVYSVVNSIHTNLPNLAGVVLLWNGQQRPTFAGHLDTGRPLAEDRSLVARGGSG